MKKIYKYVLDYSRMGYVDGLFIAEESEIQAAMGKTIYFGEILGKYSEVIDDLTEDSLTVLSDNQDFIAKFIEVMGDGTISGYNPLDYIQDEDEDEDE